MILVSFRNNPARKEAEFIQNKSELSELTRRSYPWCKGVLGEHRSVLSAVYRTPECMPN